MDLGFAEEIDSSWLLTNPYFPSKVGGKPAWLELKKIPKTNDIKCSKCEKLKTFLCQIYAPIEEKDDCFHRTIYIFVCRNESCYEEKNLADLVTVFRSQLPRNNDFYSYNPPDENQKLPPILSTTKFCSVCGCYGPYSCSKCKEITYCGAEHQKYDWKHHKTECGQLNLIPDNRNEDILFPEFEIVIEPESSDNVDEIQLETSDERVKEYENQIANEGVAGELKNISDSELSKYFNNKIDKQFDIFKKQIKQNSKQILRYKRNGDPLWITDGNFTDIEIKNCEICGSKRVYEFQIMPQLLNYLNDHRVDWGVLAIYTCSESCSLNEIGYAKEYVIKQDIVSDESENKDN